MGERLDALLAEADRQDLALDPQAAVLRGDLTHASEFGDLISDAHFRRVEAHLRGQWKRLAAIDRSQLDARRRVAFDVFRYQTGFALRQFDEGHVAFAQQMPLDPIFGRHIGFAQFSSGAGGAPFQSLADYEAGLARLDGFVTYLDRVAERQREGLAAGRVHPTWIVEKVIAQLDEQLAQRPKDSPYYLPVANFPATIEMQERERLRRAYLDAIEQRLRPAWARLRDHLRSQVRPFARTSAGLSALPGGRAYYEYQLESHTTVRLGADAIHRLGLAEVARIRAAMQRIRRQLGFAGSLKEFFEHLRSDGRFKHASRESLLGSYEVVRQRVDAKLPQWFAALPKSKLEVRAVPSEQEGSVGGAYYQVGTPDGSRPGVFYVNTSQLPTRTTPRTTALFLHEGLPGHHLQASLAQEDGALPPTLRFAWNAGYGEGWALYCEWLGHEMGLYDDPYQHYGQLDMEIFRAARLVVDTGLHARAWSRERAVQYLLDNTSLERAFVEGEVDRYIVWPGQATAYKIGELRIRSLRRQAERALGRKRFDIRAFHAQVLDTGAVPLHVLEMKINHWIRSHPR